MDIYLQFLEYVRSKEYEPNTITELHHEPPHHTGESSNSSLHNVRASLQDHSLLHYYRWLAYGQKEDKSAWLWRIGQTEEARKEMNLRRIEVCKENKIGFWDPEVQSRLGQRGAVVSHEIQRTSGSGRWNSETQRRIALMGNTFEVRKKKGEGGKIGGTKSVETRKQMGVGVFSAISRSRGNRLGNLVRWGYLVGGEKLKWDFESRKCLSETFKDYVLEYGFPK